MIPMRIGPLVRAASPSTVVVWAEFHQPGLVTLSARPSDASSTAASTVSSHTVNVGGRHYIALQLTNLQPATWYTYHLDSSADQPLPASAHTAQQSLRPLRYQCFRTLEAQTEHLAPTQKSPLRIAYGSCRDLRVPEHDAFSAFGAWLLERFLARDTQWPHLLLLIGDQIYADEPSAGLLQHYPHLRKGAQTFEDFACMYTYSWTSDEQVRQVLATLPTYMIFDDHEITNNFNISPTWRARAIHRGWEALLVDGLAAYWIYQGWGNLYQREPSQHPLLHIMQTAALTGEDALEALRACISSAIREQSRLPWYYDIPTQPSIFVMDVRADRPAIFDSQAPFTESPTSIMHPQQMEQLASWLYEKNRAPVLLVSSVPVLLPPLIGLAEYLMGIRPFYKRIAPLRRLGHYLARLQHKLAMGTSFDHWPIFNTTWHKLVDILAKRRQHILVLSGDVHFSYAMQAQHTHKTLRTAHLYQLVSTPLQNELSPKNRRLILGQAWLHRATYGGLRTHMLPMYTGNYKQRVPHNMLLQTTIAMVTLQLQANGNYKIQQEYLGFIEGKMAVVGRTIIEPPGN
ncbi:MAG: alkaline phosphatase D family protein [Ktedonobacteraceae bacterium]|jgi:hypothetical protein